MALPFFAISKGANSLSSHLLEDVVQFEKAKGINATSRGSRSKDKRKPTVAEGSDAEDDESESDLEEYAKVRLPTYTTFANTSPANVLSCITTATNCEEECSSVPGGSERR